MTAVEKVAYLKGLAEGLGLDENNKTDKLIKTMIEVLDDLALSVADVEDDIAEIADQVDAVDEDLSEVEKYLYEDDDCCDCEDCGDEEYYEVTCPACGEKIYLDEDMMDEDFINCPACGEKLEFEEDECDGDCCDGDCCHE